MKLELLPRTDLAVRALRYLHRGGRRTSDEIAAAVGTTAGFVPHVLSPLVSAKWVASQRGPAGGYSLLAKAKTGSILQLIEIMEGPTSNRECVLRGSPCPSSDVCALHDAWASARVALTNQLDLIPVLQEA